MGIDITLKEISERLAAVNAAAMIQLHQRFQQTQLTVEKSYKEQLEYRKRIEAEFQTNRQEVEGLCVLESYVCIIMHLLM